MKNLKTVLLILGCLAAAAVILISQQSTSAADNPATSKTATPAVDQQLYAQASSSGDPAINKKAIYGELKRLMKEYRRANEAGAKARIETRMDDLVGQLLDAKVVSQQQHISDLEAKLTAAQDHLHQMQLHKQDLIHEGVQRALQQGQLPDFEKKQGVSQ
ncbi:MAG: hypothetical protein NTW14_11545 [bacterium]|nr:hypothetical protein [bacterium]